MLIIAIDPAKPKKSRGFATFSTISRQFCLEMSAADWVVCEGQWVNAIASKQSLMTLSFYAGLLLGSIGSHCRARMAVLPVKTWKGTLIPGFGQAPKAVYARNLAQMLARAGHDVPKSEHDLEARGIALAASMLDLEAYEIT